MLAVGDCSTALTKWNEDGIIRLTRPSSSHFTMRKSPVIGETVFTATMSLIPDNCIAHFGDSLLFIFGENGIQFFCNLRVRFPFDL